MSLEVSTAVEPEYVRITVTGEYSFSCLFGFIEFVKKASSKNERRRALIDCRQMTGKMTEVERFEGGQHIAKIFGGGLRTALMMPADGITKLGELTARNRGAKFLVTPSETEALEWLLAA
jgi:hypothetical protein